LSDAPRRKLRIGVAGLGRAFTAMLPTFTADPRVRLVAAADPRPEARQRFAADDHGQLAFEHVIDLFRRRRVRPGAAARQEV